MSLVNKTLRGTAWAYGSLLGSRLITFGVNAALVRLLTPRDFGLRGLALIVIGLFEATQSLGINDALIYQSEEVEETANTVFLLNILIGLVLSILVALFAMWVGPNLDHLEMLVRFLGETNLNDIQAAIGLLPILGSCFFILSLGQTHQALLSKELDFRARFWPEMISAVLRGGVSIGLALMGYGVLALVYGQVVGCVVRTISNWIVVPWRPQFHFYPRAARRVWRFASGITIFNGLSAASDKFDETVIGSLLGSSSLGFYTEANRFPELLVINLNYVVGQVLFPAYSKLKDDVSALASGFLATTRYMSIIATPVALGIVIIAPEFVSIYFGPGWEPAVRLLQVLTLTTLWSTLAWSAGDIYKATGRPGLLTRLTLIEALVAIPLLLAGAFIDRMGITNHPALAATIGHNIGYLFSSLLRLAVVSRLLRIGYFRILREFIPAFIAGTVMVIGVLAVRQFVLGSTPLILLIISVIVGAGIYLVVIWMVGQENIITAARAIRSAIEGDDMERVEQKVDQAEAAEPVAISCRIMTDAGQIPDLKAKWDDLLANAVNPNFFLSYGYVEQWWPVFGRDKLLRLVLAYANGELVGLLPLYITQGGRGPFKWRELTLIGCCEGADHLDALVRRGYEDRVPFTLLDHTLTNRRGWDAIELSALDKDGLIPNAARRMAYRWEREDSDPCPYAELPGKWETYYQTVLSQHQRKKQRRFARRLEEAHPGQVHYWCVASEPDRERILRRLFDLHIAKWEAIGNPSIFEDVTLVNFHHRVTRLLLEQGRLRMYVLTVAGQDIAVEYGFRYGDTNFAYQAAFDWVWNEYSPGHLMTQFAIEQAIAEGVTTYDFMRGDEDYKLRWATGVDHDQILRLMISPRASLNRLGLNIARLIWGVVKPAIRGGRSGSKSSEDGDQP